ncbi:hypothetical protein [Phyllobacterium zundukense]|uniref:Uncharacterized protein n=1 Tax=Phyllobacterium zundukense TaxID=1867719 RepID=A0ACD4D0M0_9HYPH|nr:hypothetical protein [Phyllobacterium zundukense]UXN59260.1 hypothetical protein N8E88_21970 [Phyllobacterium zundukense]
MVYAYISQADFLKGNKHTEVVACWMQASSFSTRVTDTIFRRTDDLAPDYYTPIAKGKEWLFELTCKHQPRTGALLMAGGPLFVRVEGRSEFAPFYLNMGLEVRGKVILLERNFWGNNPSDPDYQDNIEDLTAWLTKRDGRPNHAEQRQLSLPRPIREAYYTRFMGLNIPDSPTVGIYRRLLPRSINAWQSWDGYLGNFRGYKKKYIPWLEERLGIVPTPFDRKHAYISFMMFMAAGPNPAGREGDVFFVKNNETQQDGVIYHIKDADIENMRILSEPAEAIDRYCEHILLEREGRFDFMPFTSEM